MLDRVETRVLILKKHPSTSCPKIRLYDSQSIWKTLARAIQNINCRSCMWLGDGAERERGLKDPVSVELHPRFSVRRNRLLTDRRGGEDATEAVVSSPDGMFTLATCGGAIVHDSMDATLQRELTRR